MKRKMKDKNILVREVKLKNNTLDFKEKVKQLAWRLQAKVVYVTK